MNSGNPAASEWREHWPLVLASMAGLSFAAIASASMGLFMEPLERDFGWSRAEVSAGLSIYALVAVPLSPFVGALIDRWGARRLAIPGMTLTAAAFAGFSLANGSTIQWLGLWTIYSVLALAIRNTVWTTAVSSVFDTARGLALALTLSGSAIAQILAPVAAQQLIDNLGWRDAYFWIGIIWGGIVLALILPFFFDARDARRQHKPAPNEARDNSVELPGLSPREAIRNFPLIKIALSTLIIIVTLSAISIHLVPILGERGISRESAALMAALAGGFAILGKVATGWLYDKGVRGWINAIGMGLPALAALLLVIAEGGLLLIVPAVMMIGYANGAVIQICAYLTGRYGGLRHYGKIFGVMASLIALGVGIGPVISGFIFDAAGDYRPLLTGAIPAALLAGALVLALGPYPAWDRSPANNVQ